MNERITIEIFKYDPDAERWGARIVHESVNGTHTVHAVHDTEAVHLDTGDNQWLIYNLDEPPFCNRGDIFLDFHVAYVLYRDGEPDAPWPGIPEPRLSRPDLTQGPGDLERLPGEPTPPGVGEPDEHQDDGSNHGGAA